MERHQQRSLASKAGLDPLPDGVAESILRQKLEGERMRLVFLQECCLDDGPGPVWLDQDDLVPVDMDQVQIVVERGMTSPVCKLTVSTRRGQRPRSPSLAPMSEEWEEQSSAVLRAGRQELLEDALVLAMGTCGFLGSGGCDAACAELYLPGSKTEAVWRVAMSRLPDFDGVGREAELEDLAGGIFAEMAAWTDVRLEAALKEPGIQRMLRIICNNAAV